jgi:hypothetical protein
MTKRNEKTKAGLQSAKAVNNPKIANEMAAHNEPATTKSRPH